MSATYNELEPYAAQWIRNLVAANLVAPGVVDERSIKEIQPCELGNGQVHLFAGIAVWSHALRMAGYPDSFPVWSASCPCQPFSAAGRGEGVDDARHLWPDAFRLIAAKRPVLVVGEQVASPDGLAWLDVVFADLEGAGYACRAVDICAAGFGAPHIRQRLYWAAIRSDRLAHHHQQGRGQFGSVVPEDGNAQSGTHADGRGAARGLADDRSEGRREVGSLERGSRTRSGTKGLDERSLHSSALDARPGLAGSEWMWDADGEHPRGDAGASDRAQGGARLRAVGDEPRASGAAGRLGFAGFAGFAGLEGHAGDGDASGESRRVDSDEARSVAAPGPTNGHWASVEWLPCRDGKWRPTQPGLFPLAHGPTERVGRLKAYGNGLVAPQAREFLEALKPCVEHLWRAS